MPSRLNEIIRNFFKTFSVMIFAGMGLVLIAGLAWVYYLVHDLPDVAQLKVYRPAKLTEVFSAEGKIIGEFYTERRYPVKFEAIPQHVVHAFVSAEDSNFFEHKGVDLVAFARAALNNLISGRYAQGASTITQQVARSIVLDDRRKKVSRKIREMVLAYQMEKQLTKNEIITLYLNEIFLGHRSYGIGAAARHYFQKEVEDLSVAEGSMLAGLPQRPTYWNPVRDPYKAKLRQRYVLKRMVAEEYISTEEANEALMTPLQIYPIKTVNAYAAPYFNEYVRLHLIDKYGKENVTDGGFKVHTTVKYDFQKQAEESLDWGLRETDKRLGWRGPVRMIRDELEISTYRDKAHDRILASETPSRILPPDITAESNKLVYDLTEYENTTSPFFGNTPVKVGKIYEGIVTEVFDEKNFVQVAVGQTLLQIDLKSMSWVKVNDKKIKKVSEVLSIGDVVELRVQSIDRTNNVATASLEQKPEVQGALLSYNVKTGFVEAMVGGRDFLDSQFNRALNAKRQVGSTFKPLVYAAAFDKGFSPASIVTDSPIVFRSEAEEAEDAMAHDWKPRNYGKRFRGELPLRQALIHSMNVPTIKLLNEIGVDYAIRYARTLGIETEFPRDLTIGLGSWSSSLEEIMRAYSIFPRLGRPVHLEYLTKVVNADGETLEEYQPDLDQDSIDRTTMSLPEAAAQTDGGLEAIEGEEVQKMELPDELVDTSEENSSLIKREPAARVISPQTAYIMTDLLRSVVREGTGRRASGVPGAVAGKTGTSNDFHDAWFVGFTPDVVTGVWVGYDKDKPIGPGEAGGRVAAPIFAKYMKYVVKQYPREDFRIPPDIVFAYMDKSNGRLANSQTSPANRKKVAFKAGLVPNRRGDNIVRVGEPSLRKTSARSNDDQSIVETVLPKSDSGDEEEGFSDLLREGYQENE